MPALYRFTSGESKIIIRRTTEDYANLADTAHPDDLQSALRFSNIARRTGHLAARSALRELVPNAVVEYSPEGAPNLKNSRLHISLSHGDGAVAAIISNKPCAIDIEDSTRDFTRAAPKFVSPAEMGLPGSSHPLFLPIVWCAKETLYKYARTPSLDFKRDLQITAVEDMADGNPATGKISARIRDKSGITVHTAMADRFIFCFICNITGGGKIK